MTALTVPQLSIAMEEARVSSWLVADGEQVYAGQPLVEVETDKATVVVDAPEAGRVRIVAAEGAIVPVDGVLAEIERDAAAVDIPEAGPAVSAPTAAEAPVAAVPPAAAPPAPARRPIASPAARRLAHERGIDVAGLTGTGPGGRILVRDVLAVEAVGSSDDRLREAVVRNVTASWQQIPHVHIGGELVADGLVAARAAAVPVNGGITVTDFLVLALARALAEVPELNAVRRADGSVERASAVHLALAVATGAGVVAPVIRDAGARSLAEVSRERRRLVDAARRGALDGRDLAGGSCTLSNLGAYPVDFFAPVVSGPQVAMVATGRVIERVVAENGWVGVRPRMWVNVAIDHRAADGEAGGRLLAAFERQLAALPGGHR